MIIGFRKEDPGLDKAIADLYSDLEGHDSHTDEYQTAVAQIVKLNDLKNKGIDPNTLLTVLGNLAIGFAVLKYEGDNIVTTKLWSFLAKI